MHYTCAGKNSTYTTAEEEEEEAALDGALAGVTNLS